MMTEDQKIQLIEGYVLENLSEQDLQLLTQLRESDPTIEEQIAFYEDLHGGAVLFGDEQFKLELQEMEQGWLLKQQTAERASLKEKWQSLTDKAGNLMDQLAEFFLPVPNYEAALLQASRSSAAGLIAPKNGSDVEGELRFDFEKPLTEAYQFTVENNQQEIVKQKTLTKGIEHFTLEVTDYMPGRYYWKLTGERETTIGMFFVGRS